MKPWSLAVILFFAAVPLQATEDSWTCEATSAEQLGSTEFLTCGIGEGTEQAARDASLDAAIGEWNQLCDHSASCKPFESTAVPRRIECREVGDGRWRCVRAVLWLVSGTRKSDVILSVPDLEKSIAEKRETLDRLQDQLRLQRESETLNQQLDQSKLELSALNDKDQDAKSPAPEYHIVRHPHPWTAVIGFGYSAEPLKGTGVSLFSLNVAVERRLSNWLGVRVLVASHASDSNTPAETGSPNTSTTYVKGITAIEYGLSVPIHFPRRFYVAPEIGALNGTMEQVTRTYSSLGIQNDSAPDNLHLNQTYYGAVAGYSSLDRDAKAVGWYCEVGYRKYDSSNGFHGQGAVIGRIGVEWTF